MVFHGLAHYHLAQNVFQHVYRFYGWSQFYSIIAAVFYNKNDVWIMVSTTSVLQCTNGGQCNMENFMAAVKLWYSVEKAYPSREI